MKITTKDRDGGRELELAKIHDAASGSIFAAATANTSSTTTIAKSRFYPSEVNLSIAIVLMHILIHIRSL